MIKRLFKSLNAVTVLLAALVALAMPASAEVDFSGKKITLIIPFRDGGGSTVYVRFLEPFLKKYIPGNPTLIVRNIPGGGSVKGLNYFVRKAKPDGLMLSNTGSGTVFKYVLGHKSVKYDLKDFIPIIASPFGALIYADTKLGVTAKNLEKLKGKKLAFGGRSPTAGELPIILAFELLGLDVKYIFGLSSGKRRQAFMRNEVNITYDNMAAYSKKVVPMIKEGKAEPLFTLGFMDAKGKIGRDPMRPDLPTFLEVYKKFKGKELTGPPERAMRALFVGRVMAAKTMLLPKGTPKEIVDTYHAVMKKVVADPDFTEGRGKKIVGPYPQALGEDARAILMLAAGIDAEARTWLKTWLNKRFGTTLKELKKKKKKKKKQS